MPPDLDDAELTRRLAARTLELVDVPSESRDEAAVAAHVLRVLQEGGVAARDAGDSCVVADLGGPADGPLVLLAGHYDTVPAQGNRPGRIEDGVVFGCGACDMKAAIAVMVELALLRPSWRARVQLVMFGREELPPSDSALTPLLAREAGLAAADFALVMEPTANQVHAGCVGNINLTWSFHGRAGHSARPWQADNAIERAARGIAALAELAPPVEHVFDGLTFTEVCSVTTVHGGVAQNVIPDRVDAHVNYRYPPGPAPAEAEAKVRALLEQAAPGSSVELLGNAPSGAVHASHPLTQRLVALGELEVLPKQAWTPVAELAAAGVPGVNLGPGDPRWAHQRDEQVSEAALLRCARVVDAWLSS